MAIGLLIGIPPLQFPLLVLMLRFLESLSHANARVSFGRIGDRLLISPRFHRAHHGVLAAGQRSANYGAILPWWDMLVPHRRFRPGPMLAPAILGPRRRCTPARTCSSRWPGCGGWGGCLAAASGAARVAGPRPRRRCASRQPSRPARSWMNCQATRPEREPRVTDHSAASVCSASRPIARPNAVSVAVNHCEERGLVAVMEADP